MGGVRSGAVPQTAIPPAVRGYSPSGGRPFPIVGNYATPPGLRAPAAAYTGIRPGALNTRGGRRGLPYAYWLAPYYATPYGAPFADYGAGAPDSSPGYDPTAIAMSQDALAEQVQRLAEQLAQMQAGQQQPTPSAQLQPDAAPSHPVTLVLRDGKQVQVQSYAVMNQTFWDFSGPSVRKIPVANIDIAASAKATEAEGGEFPQINTLP